MLGAMAVVYGAGRRCAGAIDDPPDGLGTGVQLHAVHADLHALPVHGGNDARRIRSVAFTGTSIAWSLGLAWLFSFVFYQGARLLGY
ncbi:MAG: hypothetical protein MZV65_30360 [Chromatiales bacterium]|nr:hypothetical protein [Chromatiales bacterium]